MKINIKNIIKEELNEYVAYHGSPNNFDKFNHKKYLSSGAGSQSFGWGTYITDDIEIAKGYINNENGYFLINGKPCGDDLLIDEIRKILQDILYSDKYIYLTYEVQNNELLDFEEIVYFAIKRIKRNIEDKNGIIQCEALYNEQMENIKTSNPSKKTLLFISLHELYKTYNIQYVKNNATLYEVDIPEDNGENYLYWYSYADENTLRRIMFGFKKLKPSILQKMAQNNEFFSIIYEYYLSQNNKKYALDNFIKSRAIHDFFYKGFQKEDEDCTIEGIYRKLSEIMGSPKAASLFLMNCCGYVGIKYQAGTLWGLPEKAKEGSMNFVIFNSNNIKITKKTKV